MEETGVLLEVVLDKLHFLQTEPQERLTLGLIEMIMVELIM